jgi:L-fuculose-phosphate aldolase
MSESAIRTAIVEVNAELERRGLNVCATGNISVRFADGMLITPAGCRVETLAPHHIVYARFDGTHEGPLRPSSETSMHRAVYQHAPSANAVVHTHADHCVALATFRQPIPAFHYMIQGFGGMDVPCVDYYPFGSEELGEAAGSALKDRTACLLANHGMLTRGTTLLSAFEAALKLEALAKQYLLARSIGTPTLLTAEEWVTVQQQYRTYGKPQALDRQPRWQVP